jgi:hypothetical protein
MIGSTALGTAAYAATGDFQAADAELAILAGLTFADVSLIQLTGAGSSAVVTSGGNNYIIGSNSDNSALEFKTPEAVRVAVGAVGLSGSMTDEQLVCGENTDGTTKIKSCGAKTTDNSTASHIMAKDDSGEVENLTPDSHLSLTGTTAPALAVITAEVDGHTDATVITAASMTGPGAVVYNTGQDAADTFLYFPTAAAGLSALFTVGTTQAGNHWGVCTNAAVTDKIYLIAADGTVAAGDDDGCVWMVAATIGQAFACWSFKTDAYDWFCKSISIAGSTFVAGADH